VKLASSQILAAVCAPDLASASIACAKYFFVGGNVPNTVLYPSNLLVAAAPPATNIVFVSFANGDIDPVRPDE